MTNFLVIGSILFIVGIAVAYLVKVIPCVIAEAIVQKNRRFSEKACTLEKGCGLSFYKT